MKSYLYLPFTLLTFGILFGVIPRYAISDDQIMAVVTNGQQQHSPQSMVARIVVPTVYY